LTARRDQANPPSVPLTTKPDPPATVQRFYPGPLTQFQSGVDSPVPVPLPVNPSAADSTTDNAKPMFAVSPRVRKANVWGYKTGPQR
jgi:hypothetical protein